MSKKTKTKPKQLRVGDRFRWVDALYPDYITLIEYVGDNDFVNLEVYRPQVEKIGDVWDGWHIDDEGWEYVGNFSKTNRFDELYNLLNESTE